MLPDQTEIPVVIPCEDDTLIGIVNKPQHVNRIGVVIIVAGGPQYRVGAHRQFVTLARLLASHAVASIRFDHRGTGDSTGALRGFVDMNADIQGAVNVLLNHVPEVEKVVLWGECESATASAFYSYSDARVQSMFMVNPWIRTDVGLAKTMLKHYYWRRISQKTFWVKVMSGNFSVMHSLKSYMGLVKSAIFKSDDANDQSMEDKLESLPLPERLVQSCVQFEGGMFILTSGYDHIAEEFTDYVKSSEAWQALIASGQVIIVDIPDADHTFSRFEWRKKLLDYTVDWVIRPESIKSHHNKS